MSYRRIPLVPGEHYHAYNRGNNKEVIFHDFRDYTRFLFLILFLQSPTITFKNIGRQVSHFEQHGCFNIEPKLIDQILATRELAILTFSIMPNHFHTQQEEIKEGGISRYMQRIQTAYGRYYNEKYKERHVGHIFQGVFKTKHQSDNRQLLHTSAYIHRNPKEIPGYEKREKQYQWSSYQDYIGKNRWGDLLKRNILLEQFGNEKEYEDFVDSSPAKSLSYEDLEIADIIPLNL